MRRILMMVGLVLLVISPLRAPVSATGNAPLAADLVAYPALEVTQGVQTYKPAGNVPLVAGKRTMVFFYARVLTGADVASTAELTAEHNGNTIKLQPLNAGGLVALKQLLPDRYHGTEQFRFELPAGFRDGTVKLTAVLNPGHNKPAESNYANNTGQKTVTFTVMPPISLSMYDIQYRIIGHGSHHYSVADIEEPGAPSQRAQMVAWMRSAYPLQTVNWKKSSAYMGRKIKYNNGNLNMLCTTVNLTVLYGINHDSNPSGPNTLGYGMVSKSGGYMRGCAEIASARVASGPTGLYDNNPATSSGAAYGGHELGHILGREHPSPKICDEGLIDSGPYPYGTGSISPRNDAYVSMAQEWGDAVLGVDVYSDMKHPKLYTSTAHDLMTYCSNRWMSDFSAKVFINYIQDRFAAAKPAPAAPSQPMDRLVMLGAIDGATGTVMLEPTYVTPDLDEDPNHQAGDHAFVLRNSAGAELLRYPFTPSEAGDIDAVDYREQRAGFDPAEPSSRMTAPRYIVEYVPWVAGTAQIDLEGPGGALLHTIKPGAAAPTVTVISPNGGTRIPPTQRTLEVQWSASDPDGDPLTYRVEYSADDGRSWYTYAMAVAGETSIELPEDVLAAGTGVRVRVSASDGIHTTSDVSDAVFTVMNHPPTLELLPAGSAPVTGTVQPVFAQGQTVSFEASAYDSDEGSLDEAVVWSSDRDGTVGSGALLSTASLSVGTHTLTAKVADSAGATAAASIQVVVVATIDELPPVADELVAIPGAVHLSNMEAITGTSVLIANMNPNRTITWNAVADKPWVLLDVTTGQTGASLLVSRAPATWLGDGEHAATITLTSPELPGVTVKIPVVADIVVKPLAMPLITR
jgi:hypothetical protein